MIGFWGGFRAKCSKGAVFYYIRCCGSSSNNWPWFLQRVQVLYLLMFWFLRIAWRVLFVRRFSGFLELEQRIGLVFTNSPFLFQVVQKHCAEGVWKVLLWFLFLLLFFCFYFIQERKIGFVRICIVWVVYIYKQCRISFLIGNYVEISPDGI